MIIFLNIITLNCLIIKEDKVLEREIFLKNNKCLIFITLTLTFNIEINKEKALFKVNYVKVYLI